GLDPFAAGTDSSRIRGARRRPVGGDDGDHPARGGSARRDRAARGGGVPLLSNATRWWAAALAIGRARRVLLARVRGVVVSRTGQRYAADAIVVLGAAQYDGRPSPVLQARLDHAAQLYRDGWSELIVVTGGIVAGDRMSEATAGR